MNLLCIDLGFYIVVDQSLNLEPLCYCFSVCREGLKQNFRMLGALN